MSTNGRIWVEAVFRPLVVAAMLGCIALSLVSLIGLFYPEWSGAYLVAGSVLAAIEAAYSRRLVRARNIRARELARFRAIEIALLFLLVLTGRVVFLPWHELRAVIGTWAQSPLQLLDLEAAFAIAIAVQSWWVANQTAHEFETMGDGPSEGVGYGHAVEALTGRFFRGGAILLIVAGITRVGLASILQLRRPSVPGLVLNVLVYFALGLVMLGQIQFSRLSKRWRDEGIDVSSRLSAHWARYTLLLLALAGLLAFLLPTGYTLSLLEVASLVIGAILYVSNVVLHLLILAFLLLITPLARLFGAELSRPSAPPSAPRPAAPTIAAEGPAPPWLEVVKSTAFWIVTLVAAAYVLRGYLRDRPELAHTLASFRPIHGLVRLLAALWRRVALLVASVRQRIPARIRARRRREEGAERPDRRRLGFLRLAALSRRERTLYYYLSILRRAARRGYPRDGSETPYEYECRLAPNVSHVEEELERVTEAFVETRYSTHRVQRAREERIRADWRKLRAALRTHRQTVSTDEEEASG